MRTVSSTGRPALGRQRVFTLDETEAAVDATVHGPNVEGVVATLYTHIDVFACVAAPILAASAVAELTEPDDGTLMFDIACLAAAHNVRYIVSLPTYAATAPAEAMQTLGVTTPIDAMKTLGAMLTLAAVATPPSAAAVDAMQDRIVALLLASVGFVKLNEGDELFEGDVVV